MFGNLRGAVDRKVDRGLIGKGSASALWCPKMEPQTTMNPRGVDRMLMAMNNFYTRHTLARQLHILSDGECKFVGTVRLNNIDAVNKRAVREAVETLKTAKNGEWRLCQTFNKVQKA